MTQEITNVRIIGPKDVVEGMVAGDIVATIDLQESSSVSSGQVELPVKISVPKKSQVGQWRLPRNRFYSRKQQWVLQQRVRPRQILNNRIKSIAGGRITEDSVVHSPAVMRTNEEKRKAV